MNTISITNTIENHLPKTAEILMSLPWKDKKFYSQYLAQTYYYVCHSVKLLKYAAERTSDPKLKAHLVHHIEEEKGHEKWAISDLKNLGFDIKNFPELQATKELYQSIYKGIDTNGPIAIVGYAMALESLSASKGPALGNLLIQIWGKKCCTFIASHGEKDQGHHEENVNLLDFFNDKDLRTLELAISESFQRFNKFLSSTRSASEDHKKSA